MTIYPAALILVNNDLTDSVQNMLVRQLAIDEIYDGYSFDLLVAPEDGYYDGYVDYAQHIKRAQKRTMVVRSFNEGFNRDIFDVVIFVKAGLAAIEENKFGPHGFTWPVVAITWKKLQVFQI